MTKITKLQLFGERNTGTNYCRKLFAANLEGVNPVTSSQGYGWKHGGIGFGKGNMKEGKNEIFYAKFQDPKYSDDTLFIVMTRNPFTWLQSMHLKPYHAPELAYLSFSKFIRKHWTSHVGPPGEGMRKSESRRLAIATDENKFEDYEDVFDLRKSKNDVFENLLSQVKNVVYINYESIRDNPEAVVNEVAKYYGLKTKPEFTPIKSAKWGSGKYKPKRYVPVSVADVDHIVKSLDWNQENMLGYEHIPPKTFGAKASRFIRKKEASLEKFVSCNHNVRMNKLGGEQKQVSIEA